MFALNHLLMYSPKENFFELREQNGAFSFWGEIEDACSTVNL